MPRVRVVGPNGETGTVEQSEAGTMPEGWRIAPSLTPGRAIPRPVFTSADPQSTRVGAEQGLNFNSTIGPDLARMGVNALPGLAAAGGMMAAAPFTAGLSIPAGIAGGMIGGGLGSFAGQAGRMALGPSVGLSPRAPSAGETAMDVAAAGLGGITAGAAKAAAPGLMRTGLRMPPTWREQWIGSVAGGELPEQAALRMRVGTRGGAAKAASASGMAERAAIMAAKQSGHAITARQLASRALKQAAEKAERALTKQEEDRIIQRTATIADELLNTSAMGVKVRNLRPRVKASALDFSATQGLTIKQAAQKLSSAKHAQQVQGLASKAVPDELKMIGESAREALAAMPGVAAPTLEAQKAMLLRRALGRAEAVQQWTLPQMTAGVGGLATGALAGHGGAIPAAVGGVVAHQLASPEAQRRLALALSSPFLQQMLRYGPLGADVGLRAMTTPPPMAPPEPPPSNPAWGDYQP